MSLGHGLASLASHAIALSELVTVLGRVTSAALAHHGLGHLNDAALLGQTKLGFLLGLLPLRLVVGLERTRRFPLGLIKVGIGIGDFEQFLANGRQCEGGRGSRLAQNEVLLGRGMILATVLCLVQRLPAKGGLRGRDERSEECPLPGDASGNLLLLQAQQCQVEMGSLSISALGIGVDDLVVGDDVVGVHVDLVKES